MAVGQRYTPAPVVPDEIKHRYETIRDAAAGAITMSEGARRLGMSRNHFQTLVHNAMIALIESVTPKPAGRPAMPESERLLRERVEKLERENAQLRQQTESMERLMAAATQVLRGKVPLTGRPPKPTTNTPREGETTSESATTA